MREKIQNGKYYKSIMNIEPKFMRENIQDEERLGLISMCQIV